MKYLIPILISIASFSMNHPVKFTNGYGLQVSSAPLTQLGLLQLDNANLELSGCVEKRAGTREVPRTTATSPDDEFDAALVKAVWYRHNEPILETSGDIYSRRDCSGDSAIDLGTATPAEINQTAAASAVRRQTSYDVLVPLSAAAVTPDANARLDRDTAAQAPMVFDDGSGIVTATLALVGGTWMLTWTGVAAGSQKFEGGVRTTFHQQNATDARLSFSFQSAPGTCLIKVYKVTLTGTTFTIAVEFAFGGGGVPGIVLGNPTNPAFEADEGGFSLLRDTAAPLLQLLTFNYVASSIREFGLSVADDATLRNGTDFAGTGFVYDTQMQLADVDGPVIALVPLLGDGKDILFVYDLPVAAAPNQTAVRTADLQTFTAATGPLSGDRIGVGFDGADIVIAFRLAEASSTDWSMVRAGGVYIFNEVVTGNFSQRYDIDSNELRIRPVVNTSALLPLTVLASPQIDVETASQSNGDHLVSVLDVLGEMRVFVYTMPGTRLPALNGSFSDVLAFDVDSESVAGFFAVGRLDVVGGVTRHVLLRSTNLFAFTPSTVVVPDIAEATVGAGLCVTIIDDGGGEATYRVSNYNNDTTSPDYRVLRTYSFATLAGAETNIREDAISSVSTAGASVTHLELGVAPRIITDVFDLGGGSEQVFETDTALFVRVSPATIALAGGNWTRRGPWTKGVLDIDTSMNWEQRKVLLTSAATVISPSSGGKCVLQLQQLLFDASLEAVVYGTHAESGGPSAPVVLDVLGTTPHVGTLDESTAAYVFADNAGALLYQFWSPGESFTFDPVGITLNTAGDRIYDADTGRYQARAFHAISAWADVPGPAIETAYQVRGDDDAVIVNFTAAVPGFLPDAVAVYAINDVEAPWPVVITAELGSFGGTAPTVLATAYEIVSGTPMVLWTRSVVIAAAADTGIAITVGAKLASYRTEGEFSAEYQEATSTEYVIKTYAVETGSETLLRTQRRASIHGSTREVGGALVHVESTVDSVSTPLLRNGLFLVSPSTGEVLGRWAVASSGGGTSSETYPQRPDRGAQVQDLNILDDELTYGFQVETGVVNARMTTSQFAHVDYGRIGNRPAELQQVAISAHAGYPRGYDGVAPYEQDWHELPRIVSVSDSIGGLISPGQYGVAVTYEWLDSQGNRYRSAPDFGQVTVVNSAISFMVSALSRSERIEPYIRFWRTIDGGSIYYSAFTAPATSLTDVVDVTIFSPDIFVTTQEQLDQTLGGVLSSIPGRVTEWMATLDDGRLWSRDPVRDSLARFSIPAAEGNAPHWNPVQGLEVGTSRAIRAAGAMDGRKVLFTPSEAHQFAGPGPDATGAGAFATPARIPSEIGCDNHNTVALTQDGLVFGSQTGPQILSRGMSVLDFSAVFYSPYRDDGEVVQVIIYDPVTSSTYIGDGSTGRVFTWNHSTIRASENTGRPTLDAAVSRSGEVTYLINDGRVLVQEPPVNASSPRTDGPVPYEFAVSTAWIRVATRDGNAMPLSNMGQLLITGEWRGPHSLFLDIYRDYSETPTETLVVPESRITTRHALGKPYLYVFKANAVASSPIRAVLRDGGAPGPSFRVEQIDLQLENPGGERQLEKGAYFQKVPV